MQAFYRSNLAWGLYGVLIGALATVAIVIASVRSAIIHEHPSPYKLSTTVDRITAKAVERGWKVLRVEEIQPQVQVIELSQPDYVAEMLRAGTGRSVAMMPCHIAVYERDGNVYVSHVNRELIGRFFRQEAAGVLRRVRADEREIMSFLLAR